MSVFRRRRDESTPGSTGEAASATVPVARDPDLGVPPFRPAATAPATAVVPPKASAAPAGPIAPQRPTPTITNAGASAGATAAPRAEAAERRTLVVGKGISLQGTVSDAERLVVEGTVESQMIQAQELVIHHSGVCKGELQVEDAEIAGVFDGTLTATNSLIIRATGKLLGVARCRRLQVEEGGQVTGRMEMITDAPRTNAAPATSAPVPARATESADA